MSEKDPLAVALGRRGGLKGGKARAANMTPEERSEAARAAANARWGNPPAPTVGRFTDDDWQRLAKKRQEYRAWSWQPCPVCFALVPIHPTDNVTAYHYPDDPRHAYEGNPRYYCTGSREAAL